MRAASKVSMLRIMGRREDNQRAKRERIIAAAKALFSKQGHDATTTRQIAKRARVAHGTLFLYAKTRADVVALVFESEIGAALREAEASAPEGGELTELCMHFYGAFFDVYRRDPPLARVLVKELPWLEGNTREGMRALTFELLGAVASRVCAHQAAGRVRDDVDPFMFAAATFSLYFGALTAWLSGDLGDPAGEAHDAARLLLRQSLVLLDKGASP